MSPEPEDVRQRYWPCQHLFTTYIYIFFRLCSLRSANVRRFVRSVADMPAHFANRFKTHTRLTKRPVKTGPYNNI